MVLSVQLQLTVHMHACSARAARAQRDGKASEKRRKLKEELLAREKRTYTERSEEEVARWGRVFDTWVMPS